MNFRTTGAVASQRVCGSDRLHSPSSAPRTPCRIPGLQAKHTSCPRLFPFDFARRTFVKPLLLAGLVLAACQGGGSDVGPTLPLLPGPSAKVLVLDDAGNGVSAARVTVAGAVATTGLAGRGDLFASISGRQLVQVDAQAASATSSDRLASLVCTQILQGGDLPAAVHLPNTSASAVLTVNGTAATQLTLDDTALGATGGKLVIAAGSVFSPAGPLSLRFGRLETRHLPGELPVAASGAWLFSRGYWVDPGTCTITPPATLDLPNELAIGAGLAALFHLDSATGLWTPLGTAAASGARIAFPGVVASGGLYVYAVPIAATAQITGRVLTPSGDPVGNPLVAVDSWRTIGGTDGRFALPVIAATNPDGTPRTATVEVRGSGSWLSVATTAISPALANGASVDLGNIQLDSVPVTNLRVLAIESAVQQPWVRLGMGALTGYTSSVSITGSQGYALFEDVGSGYFGFIAGHPYTADNMYWARGVGLVDPGIRWLDVRTFFGRRGWTLDGRNCYAYVLDKIGGGPILAAGVVQGGSDGAGGLGFTQEGGAVLTERQFGGRATASVLTSVPGKSIASAITMDTPYSEHLEMTVRRVVRSSQGNFERHGTVTGSFTGFSPTAQQRLRTTRILRIDDWVADVFEGEPVTANYPVKVDPTLAPGAFRAGVAVPYGNLAVAEGSTVGGVFTLGKVGVAALVAVPEATVTPLDLPLAHSADTAFSAAQALVGLDAGFTRADLSLDLALQRADTLVLDVARNIGGNLGGTGQDLTVTLPTLTGDLSGSSWLAVVGAARATATTAAVQKLQLRFDGPTAQPSSFLAMPQITAPLDGAVVATTGFTVNFTAPADALYVTLDLHSLGADELRWEAVVPATSTSFRFWTLPTGYATPLVTARTYRLTVTAYRTQGVLHSNYVDTLQFWSTIGPGSRGVVAMSSQTITVSTN